MDFQEHKMNFGEADRRYAELKRRRDAGAVSDEELDEQRRQLMVQDGEGRWWAKGRETDEWHYHDGNDWVKGTPPGYQSSEEPPTEESTPEDLSQPEQREHSRPPEVPTEERPEGPPAEEVTPAGDQSREKQRRGVPRWVMVAVPVAVLVVGLVATLAYFLTREETIFTPTSTLSGHSSFVGSVAFSPDGKLLASGSADKTIKLWDPQGGKELQTLSGHSDGVRSVAFSPDRKLLASVTVSQTVG